MGNGKLKVKLTKKQKKAIEHYLKLLAEVAQDEINENRIPPYGTRAYREYVRNNQ